MRSSRASGVAIVAALVLASCSVSSGPADPSPSPTATQPPESAAVLFVQQTPLGGVLMSGPPDGRGAVALLPPGTSGGTDFAASADGSVIAYTSAVVLPAGSSGYTSWVADHGVARPVALAPTSVGPVTSWTVSADGRAAYVAVGNSLQRYDVRTHTLTTLCATCVPAAFGDARREVAVSPDERTVAESTVQGSRFYGGQSVTDVTVVDVASGGKLWHHGERGFPQVLAWTFADDDTLITTSDSMQGQSVPEVHRVSGFRTSRVTDTATGVHGYGPFSFVDGVWWYSRDNPSKPAVTTIYVNPDLTPSGERVLAVRPVGPGSSSYTPVTSEPGPITVPAASPSS